MLKLDVCVESNNSNTAVVIMDWKKEDKRRKGDSGRIYPSKFQLGFRSQVEMGIFGGFFVQGVGVFDMSCRLSIGGLYFHTVPCHHVLDFGYTLLSTVPSLHIDSIGDECTPFLSLCVSHSAISPFLL